jgi:hypothetical protein
MQLVHFFFLFLFIAATLWCRSRRTGFWAIQPVFHYASLSCWLRVWLNRPGILRGSLPELNDYTDLDTVTTQPFSAVHQRDLCDFVMAHYLRNGNGNEYLPDAEHVCPYLTDALVSTCDDGVITSRPIHVALSKSSFDVQYVDYLCVNTRQRKRGVAPKLIQTHDYRQARMVPNGLVSLFKREEELTAFVPLVAYDTVCYAMPNTTSNPSEAMTPLTTLADMEQLLAWIPSPSVTASASALVRLVATHNLVLLAGPDFRSFFAFRATCVYLAPGKSVLGLCCALGEEVGRDFLPALHQARADHAFLSIELLADAHRIVLQETAPIATSPTAYFLYNYVTPTVDAKSMAILI